MSRMTPLITVPERVKLRVEDYLTLDDAGAFDGYGKTELLDGDVVHLNAQYRPHARVKSRLHLRIARALDDMESPLEALVEASVAMPPHNAPEPDIAITADAEGEGLIPLAALALGVEVADTTLENDLGRKRGIYAAAGVPEYWVVDVNECVIHQFWSAQAGAFTQTRRIPFGAALAAATIVGLTIATDRL